LVLVVALKTVAAEFDWPRSVPSTASSLVYLGAGVGGMLMAWLSDRIGVMWPAMVGATMVGIGAMVASRSTDAMDLWLSHGILIGLLGNAATFAPLVTNITRWFDRRRGVAVALVASGQSVSGAVWPSVFGYGIEEIGWRSTMFYFGIFVIATMAPLALFLRRRPPIALPAGRRSEPRSGEPVLGLSPSLVLAMVSLAIVGCCIAMAMPMVHMVAFCSDLGYQPQRGAEMLSLLLAAAFLSRLFWGRLSDRIGGLRTILFGAAAQAAVLAFYIVIENLVALYALSISFGLAFGGIVPAYTLVVRELFPSREAGWRIGVVYFFGTVGMALGAYLGGALYDLTLSYPPAFLGGVLANLATIVLIGALVLRQMQPPHPAPAAA
jgi:MFS family permease